MTKISHRNILFIANNLYGWAMMKPLPVGDFEWMEEKKLKKCILEADLEYLKKLHDFHDVRKDSRLEMLKNSFQIFGTRKNISFTMKI